MAFFRRFLVTVVKKAKHIKVAPGIYPHFCDQSKNLSVIILVLKIFSSKIWFFWLRSKPGPQPDTASYLLDNSLKTGPSRVVWGGGWGTVFTIGSFSSPLINGSYSHDPPFCLLCIRCTASACKWHWALNSLHLLQLSLNLPVGLKGQALGSRSLIKS